MAPESSYILGATPRGQSKMGTNTTPEKQQQQQQPSLQQPVRTGAAAKTSCASEWTADPGPEQDGPSSVATSHAAALSTGKLAGGGMDPKLKRRIQEQLAKEMTGDAAMGEIASASTIEKHFEPELRRRMETQLAKEAGKAQALPTSLERTDKIVTKLDPKLEQRMCRQQEKLSTGESDVKDDYTKVVRIACQADLEKRMVRQREKVVTGDSDVIDNYGKDHKIACQADLERRMARQRQKVVTGESDVKDSYGKDVRIACQADLELRMAKQREKVVTGVSAVGEVGSAAQEASRVNPELAALFERRRLLREGRLPDDGARTKKRHQLGMFLRRLLCLGARKAEA